MIYRAAVAATLGMALLIFTTGAMAADDLTGKAAIRGKNTRTNTIQLGDRTFRLDGDSVIRSADGSRMSLTRLPVPDFGRGGKDLMLGSMIGRYVAERSGPRLILKSLEIEGATD